MSMSPVERRLALAISALSHLGGLPFVYTAFKRGCLFEGVIAIATFTCSFMYHAAEILAIRLLGMNDGNWHRLDNVFICLGMICLFLFFMDNSREADELLRWSFLVVTLWFQEQGPWRLENMLAPIVLAFCLCLGVHLYRRTVPWWFVAHPAFHKGVGVLVAGSYFFIVGLDDAHDYLRAHHSAWHFCTAVAFLYFFSIPKPPSRGSHPRDAKPFTA